MVRTLETATGAFGSGPPQGAGSVMMTSLEPRQEWQSEHAAVSLPPGIPVISHEGCRERVSKLSCTLYTTALHAGKNYGVVCTASLQRLQLAISVLEKVCDVGHHCIEKPQTLSVANVCIVITGLQQTSLVRSCSPIADASKFARESC